MQPFTIDADFPGGNIVLEKIEDDVVTLHHDLRDTAGPWFYWAFRVRGAAGLRLEFRFTDGDVLGVRGPAISTDGGGTWQWLGTESVRREEEIVSFNYDFPPDADEVFIGFCPLYTQSNLNAFLVRLAGHDSLKREILCTSRAGRDVERLRLESPTAPYRVLLTARHHACETMASFCLEGLLESALGDDELGQWLRANVSFAVVPFMDKDGVETGDQGKNRKPHDHNRDYGGEITNSIYPEVCALREWAPSWLNGGEKCIVMDMHCPWIRGERNEEVYFVGLPNQRVWQTTTDFSRALEAECRGPLPYREANNLPFGQEWNVASNVADGHKPMARWASELEGVHFATSLEVPYANAGGAEVTPDSARALGRDIALALRAYLGIAGTGTS